MKTVLFILLTGLSIISNARNTSENLVERKGFIFGASVGASVYRLDFPAYANQNGISASMPNFKIGMMISNRTALVLSLPGTIYTHESEGRVRERGFEGIIPSVQYWPRDRWWLMAGTGLGMDAPVFYDIKNESERKFYFGFAAIAGTGYELWHKEKFALDIQSRVHFGTANLPDGKLNGLAFDFLIGFNWY